MRVVASLNDGCGNESDLTGDQSYSAGGTGSAATTELILSHAVWNPELSFIQ